MHVQLNKDNSVDTTSDSPDTYVRTVSYTHLTLPTIYSV